MSFLEFIKEENFLSATLSTTDLVVKGNLDDLKGFEPSTRGKSDTTCHKRPKVATVVPHDLNSSCMRDGDILNTRNESDVTAMRRVFTIDVDARDVWPSKVEDAVHEVIEECGDFVPKEIFSAHLI